MDCATATMAGLEAEVETIYGSLGELKKQVDVIHGGWAID